MKLRTEHRGNLRLKSADVVLPTESEAGFNLEAELEKRRKGLEEFLHRRVEEFKYAQSFIEVYNMIGTLAEEEILKRALGKGLLPEQVVEEVKERLFKNRPSPEITGSQLEEDLGPAADWVELFPDQQGVRMSDRAIEENIKFIRKNWSYPEDRAYLLAIIRSLIVLRPDKKVELSKYRLSKKDLERLNREIDQITPENVNMMLAQLANIKLLLPDQFSQLKNWENVVAKIPEVPIDEWRWLNMLTSTAILLDQMSHLDENCLLVVHQIPRRIKNTRPSLPLRAAI